MSCLESGKIEKASPENIKTERLVSLNAQSDLVVQSFGSTLQETRNQLGFKSVPTVSEEVNSLNIKVLILTLSVDLVARCGHWFVYQPL